MLSYFSYRFHLGYQYTCFQSVCKFHFLHTPRMNQTLLYCEARDHIQLSISNKENIYYISLMVIIMMTKKMMMMMMMIRIVFTVLCTISYTESTGVLVSGWAPEKTLENSKNFFFLIGCPVTACIVLPQKSCGNKIPDPRVPPVDQPLAKEPGDTGYEVVLCNAVILIFNYIYIYLYFGAVYNYPEKEDLGKSC